MELPLEAGYPTHDQAAFRRCLSQFSTGVAVIATRLGDKITAMTSNSFSSVSLDPPLILWSIKRDSQSLPIFEAASHFTVNILAHDQVALSQNFARSGPDKFNGVSWTPGIEGVPLIDGAVATFECQNRQILDGGDHVILIGLVERYCRFDRQPLLFAQGRYAMVTDYVSKEAVVQAPGDAGGLSASDRLTTSFFLRAYKSMADVFERARRLGGLSLQESMLLRAVENQPGRTLEELLPEILLGMNTGYSIYAQLLERGFITVAEGDRIYLTADGETRIKSVIQHSLEIERETFRSLAPEDLAATRRVLGLLVARQ